MHIVAATDFQFVFISPAHLDPIARKGLLSVHNFGLLSVHNFGCFGPTSLSPGGFHVNNLATQPSHQLRPARHCRCPSYATCKPFLGRLSLGPHQQPLHRKTRRQRIVGLGPDPRYHVVGLEPIHRPRHQHRSRTIWHAAQMLSDLRSRRSL